METVEKTRDRISAIALDQKSLGGKASTIEHEREVAIFDILDGNSFAIDGRNDGPYKLALSTGDDKLLIEAVPESDGEATHVSVGLLPLKRIMKDYFLVCDSYYEAVKAAPPARIQALDVNRRSLHDEGSNLLIEKLSPTVVVDYDTARRLFTLVCALYWKG